MISPGSLVEPKSGRWVLLWSNYLVEPNRTDGIAYCMTGCLDDRLRSLALVVSVYPTKSQGDAVTYVFIPKLQQFAYVWSSGLSLLQEAA